MTLVEFLAPLATGSNKSKVLATLYFYEHYKGVEVMTADQIKKAIVNARMPRASRMNVSDVLSRCSHFVDNSGISDTGIKLWQLTLTGQKETRQILELPEVQAEIEENVSTLTKLLPSIQDLNAKDFAEESIKCLRAGLMRPAIVFLWTGAVVILRAKAFSYGASKLNQAIQKFDPKSRNISALSHLDYVKDSVLLMVLCELGEIDKGQKSTLEEALNLRNRCGHPTTYRPGQAKTSSFIEDVIGVVF